MAERAASIEKLIRLVKNIENLTNPSNYGALAQARDQPNVFVRELGGVQLANLYDNRPSDIARSLFNEIKQQMVETARANGEAEKRKRLLQFADELEVIRQEICQTAAAVCIEIGVIAREFQAEAERL